MVYSIMLCLFRDTLYFILTGQNTKQDVPIVLRLNQWELHDISNIKVQVVENGKRFRKPS